MSILTPEQTEEARLLNAGGVSWNSLGRKYDCDPKTVVIACNPEVRVMLNERERKRLHKLGVGERALSWTPDEIATLLQMHADGCRASAIGDKIGRTKNSVIGRLHRLGLCKPLEQKRDRWQADTIATLKTMISAHTPADVISRALGVSQSAIRSKLAREKMPPILSCIVTHKRVVTRPVSHLKEPVSLGLAIYDLKSTTCRWPQGDPREDMRYCGATAPIERAYCDYHHDLAHCKGTTSERRATDELDKRITT